MQRPWELVTLSQRMAGTELLCFPVAPVVWPMLTERLKTLKTREEDWI